jgi:hypothetical protein
MQERGGLGRKGLSEKKDKGVSERGEDWEEKYKVRRRLRNEEREGRTGKIRIK